VIDQLGSEPLFITRNGKVAAVLQAVSDGEVEDYLFRNSPRFWRLIESRRAQASKGATLPFDAARYEHDESAAKGMLVRDKAAPYRTKKGK
jgi:hypothetical protein